MSDVTLSLAALVDGTIAVLLVYVGWTVAHRHASPPGKRALDAFATWWYGLAITSATNAIKEVSAAAALDAPQLFVVMQYAFIVALCAAVWGLLYYLVYLFTGSERWFWPLSIFYMAYAAFALFVVWRMQPLGIAPPERWFVQWSYARPDVGGPILLVLTILLLLPQIVAAAVYLRVAKRTDEPIARFRVRVVAWSLILWLGIALLAPFLQLGRFEWWQAGGRLLGLVASIAILVAYKPPASIRARLAREAIP